MLSNDPDVYYIRNKFGELKARSRSRQREILRLAMAQLEAAKPGWRKKVLGRYERDYEHRQAAAERTRRWLKEHPEQLQINAQALVRWRANGGVAKHYPMSEAAAANQRAYMLSGGYKKLMNGRKDMTPEAIEARVQRDAMICRNYYVLGMKIQDVAKAAGVAVSTCYGILSKTPIDC